MLIFIGVQVKNIIENAQNVPKQKILWREIIFFIRSQISDHIANNQKLRGMRRSLAKQDIMLTLIGPW
jgi:hypothetical protein